MLVQAYVVLRPGIEGTPDKAEELRLFVRTVIASYKAPRVVKFLAALPRTTTGKVQRFVLREMASQ
jgi:2-aminobenzoate-CoA ligase